MNPGENLYPETLEYLNCSKINHFENINLKTNKMNQKDNRQTGTGPGI